MRHALPSHLRRDLDRHAEAAAGVVLAVAKDRRVRSDHQGFISGAGDAVEKAVDAGLIAGQVGLKPCVFVLVVNVLKLDQRGGAEYHRDVGLTRRLRQGEVASIGNECRAA